MPSNRKGRAQRRGDIAIVTGGAQGIGEAVARRLADSGYTVAIFDVQQEKGSQVAEQLAGGFFKVDVADEASISDGVQGVRDELGSPVVLVNNAGVNAYFDSLKMSTAQWESVLAIDLRGAWLCAKHIVPSMIEEGGGSIVNISSIHSHTTAAGTFPYSTAKAGLIGMTKGMALDYGPENVRVNAVSPGYIETPLLAEWFAREEDPPAARRSVVERHALRRIGTPDDVATVVVFLASKEAAFVTGTEITVDGGLTARFP